MPTARDPGGQQSRGQTALSAIAAGRDGGGGGGGSGGAVAALVQQAQEQQTQMQKLLGVIQQLQEENAVAVQQAGQQAAGAATEVANAITRQVQEEQTRGEKKRERLEDRGFQEDMARLQAKLQGDAQREAQTMATDFLARREGMKRFANRFQSQEADFDEAVDTFAARQDEMLQQGFYDSPEGRKAYTKILGLLDMAKAFGDNHFDPRHLEAAYRTHNENLHRLAHGEDPQNLASLRIDPMRTPLTEPKPSGKAIADPSKISSDKMFEMKLMGGYPLRGVVGNDEPNLGMPEGYAPKFMDMKTMMTALNTDAGLQLATDKSIRGELLRKNRDLVVKSRDKLEPLLQQYNSLNKMFNPLAPGAVDKALREFLDDPNPEKFNDMGRTLMAKSIKHILGGNANAESQAVYAMKVFDGKEEPKTPQQLTIVMALESASFNIKSHLLSEIQAVAGEGEGTLATQLVKQLIDNVGEEGAMELLGVVPGTTQIVDAQSAMQDRLVEVHGFANRMTEGFWKVGILQQFREDIRRVTKTADVLSYITQKEATDTQGRIFQLIGQQEAAAAVEQGIEAQTPSGRAESLSGFDASKLETTFGYMDAIIEINDGLGADRLTETASMLSGGEETPEDPNLPGYLKDTRRLQESSGYVRAAGKRARFNFDRQQRAKKRRAEQGPTTPESAKEGGMVGVVVDQAPALLSLGAQTVAFFGERTAAGLVQLGFGKKATTSFVRGLRHLRQAPLTPSPFGERDTVGPSNLEPEEQ